MNASPRKPLIAGNWKMNGSSRMARQLITRLVEELPAGGAGPDIMVMPPFPYLQAVKSQIGSSRLLLGAQDLSEQPDGPFTGDVSAAMLVDLGVSHVLVGHSERRQFHAETDAAVAAKFEAAVGAGLIPVLCVGETLKQRDAGQAEQVIEAQLSAVLERCGSSAFSSAVIAYEPVWAIGTGRTASPEQAEEIHAYVRTLLAGHDDIMGSQIQILYGGSMKPQNAVALLRCKDIDGGLIGGASLKAEDFLAIAGAAGEDPDR
ncbi:MAG: triose-phosphate isomerase [Wenzhouxiangellaceae bacterium]|nr:triose-phosphate isomerase [Wenzhouxiangellaceae bacterium]